MKKITILASAVFLAFAFEASAQVGIGTSTPTNSTMMDIVATDKGVMIPRVALTATDVFAPITGDEVESLLVYNTGTSTDLTADNAVTPGFYYWAVSKWNRIVNRGELDQAISNVTNNFEQVHDLINYIVPSNPNNLDDNGDQIVSQPHSTVVWDATDNSFYVVTYNDTTEVYEKNIIDISTLIAGAETNTFIKVVEATLDAEGKVVTPKIYYYYSEEAIKNWLAVAANAGKDPLAEMEVTENGVIAIDVVGDVANNFEYILKQEITYEGEQITIEEIIQIISSQVEGDVIYKEINPGEWVFQYYDSITEEYVTINLGDVVGALETKTFIRKIDAVVEADGTITSPVVYYYFNEEAIAAWMEESDTNTDLDDMPVDYPGVITIDVVGDVANNFEYILKQEITYEGEQITIEEIIQIISSEAEGNVIFGDITIGGTDYTNVLYYINKDGDPVLIDFTEIFEALETKTKITRAEIETDATAPDYQSIITAPVDAETKAGEVIYKYEAEGETNYLNITEDILYAIENNEDVKNEITEILNVGGNVYFGDINIGTDSYTDVLYYYDYTNDPDGEPKLIDIASTLIQNLIDNSSQVLELKNILGDKIENNTSIFTGDTIEGLPVISYKGTTTIGAHTAETSGVTIVLPAGATSLNGVVSISLSQGGTLVTSTVTDVEITGNTVEFNIGVGSFYHVLPEGTYDVIIYATVNE